MIASLKASVFHTKLALTEPSFWQFCSVEKSSDDELSSNTSTSCDAELLQLVVEGEGSFKSIIQCYRGGLWKKET